MLKSSASMSCRTLARCRFRSSIAASPITQPAIEKFRNSGLCWVDVIAFNGLRREPRQFGLRFAFF